MTADLIAFIRERFQPKATIPLSLLVFSAPYAMAPGSAIHFLVGTVSTFSALLCLRVADDIASVQTDALHHPQRGLVSGRISSPRLAMVMAALLVGLVLINLWSGVRALGLLAMAVFYLLYFGMKTRLHVLVRPLFSNLVFMFVPVYAATVDDPAVFRQALFMGLFAWIAAVAHEYGHSVQAAGEGPTDAETYSNLLGSRNNAVLAAAGFGIAAMMGVLFWYQAGRPRLFLMVLVMVTFHLGWLSVRLIHNPCKAKAKPFYVFGFTFFLLPYLAFIFDKLWAALSGVSSFAQIAYLIMPIILAGTCNMIFVKSPWLVYLKHPMDHGIRLRDGKRLFGDHKTWKGFLGMMLFSAMWLVVFALFDRLFEACRQLSLIPFDGYTLWQTALFGAVWGFGYVFMELPNSYAKRRIGIGPGKTGDGTTGIVFSFIDQADSVVGCLCAMLLFYVPSMIDLAAIFFFSVLVHYAMNILLYLLKLKSQPL